jgi:HlyD family secretion protein
VPDIARDPSILRRKRRRHVAVAIVCALVVAVGFIAVARMAPPAPGVDRATVVIDTVRLGSFVREVRGIGTLVPEDSRWLAATTEGRVERIRLRPGAAVVADSIILELTNPQVEQESINARLALQSAKAALESLRAQLQNDSLTQQSQVASIESEYQQAQLDFEANDALAKLQLVSPLVLKQSQLRAELLRRRAEIEKTRLKVADDSINARLQVQQAAVEQAEAVWDLQQRRLAALKVRAGFSGVLQQVPVEVGQSVKALRRARTWRVSQTRDGSRRSSKSRRHWPGTWNWDMSPEWIHATASFSVALPAKTHQPRMAP